MAYDADNKGCVISQTDICVVASTHPNYEMSFFYVVEELNVPCICWVPAFTARHVIVGYQAVGRVRNGSGQLYPGKYIMDNLKTCIAVEEDERCFEGGELLEVSSHCSVAWVSYTAGDDLPDKAVIGSVLEDGTPLYVVNVQVFVIFPAIAGYGLANTTAGDGGWAMGYYNKSDELAHVEIWGVRLSKNMEMLVVIWTQVMTFLQVVTKDYCTTK